MKYFDLLKEKLSSLWPMWLVIMLVALWSIYIQDGQINKDGLLYLKQAYLIAEGRWKEGWALYPWPFFSILIAVFHKLTSLHLQLVAHGLDLALFGIAVLFYLKTLQLIYNKEKQIIFYGGIILLSFIPIMDDYVGMVLRDHGLWAGCMMGTYFYLSFLLNQKFTFNLLWQICFTFAGLFRPEAFVFLVFIPILYLLLHRDQLYKWLTIQKTIQMYIIVLGYSFYSLINKIFLSSGQLVDYQDSRMSEFIPRLISFFNQTSTPLPITANDPYLIDLISNYPITVTYGFLLSVLIIKWLNGMGLFLCSLLVYGLNRKLYCYINPKILATLYFFIGVSFTLATVNLFIVYTLPSRYWVLHWFWIFIFITPFLLDFFHSKYPLIRFYFKPLVVILILVSIINILVDSHKINIESDASEYIKANDIIYSVKLINAERVGYYSGLTLSQLIQSTNRELKNTRYVIFQGNRSAANKIVGIDYQLKKSFMKKNKGIFIFEKLDYVE